jgi:hypothetical protein
MLTRNLGSGSAEYLPSLTPNAYYSAGESQYYAAAGPERNELASGRRRLPKNWLPKHNPQWSFVSSREYISIYNAQKQPATAPARIGVSHR